MRAKFGVRLRAKFRLDRFIMSPAVGENPPIFAVFWTSAFSGVVCWQQSEKVGHGCTATHLPLSNGIKIVSVLQRLHGEIVAILTSKSVTNKETDRQTKKLNVFGRPGGG